MEHPDIPHSPLEIPADLFREFLGEDGDETVNDYFLPDPGFLVEDLDRNARVTPLVEVSGDGDSLAPEITDVRMREILGEDGDEEDLDHNARVTSSVEAGGDWDSSALNMPRANQPSVEASGDRDSSVFEMSGANMDLAEASGEWDSTELEVPGTNTNSKGKGKARQTDGDSSDEFVQTRRSRTTGRVRGDRNRHVTYSDEDLPPWNDNSGHAGLDPNPRSGRADQNRRAVHFHEAPAPRSHLTHTGLDHTNADELHRTVDPQRYILSLMVGASSLEEQEQARWDSGEVAEIHLGSDEDLDSILTAMVQEEEKRERSKKRKASKAARSQAKRAKKSE